MDIATESGWSHDPNNFVSDNDYEKEFESYISDVDDDDGKCNLCSIIHSQIPIFGGSWVILIDRFFARLLAFCLSIFFPFSLPPRQWIIVVDQADNMRKFCLIVD